MHGRFTFLRDGVGLVWLAAAVVVSLVHRWVPEANWVMVHLVFLGAITHAILVWSRHFAHALLRARPDAESDRRHELRLILLTLGALGVVVSVPLGRWTFTAAFAAAVAAAVAWHGYDLWRLARASLPGRFRVTLWYYLTAAALLPAGATLGVLLAMGPEPVWFPRLLMAHVISMVLGWVLFTVVGTLLTFWPTLLRTRMDERAERFTRQGYPWLLAGILIAVAAALLGDPVGVGVGLVVLAFGLLWTGRGLMAPLARRLPREFAPASVGLSLVWLVAGLGWAGVTLITRGWAGFDGGLGDLAGVLAVGFGAQLLTGALSFLIPMVRGGGPSVVRAAQRETNRFATWRLVVINLGLLLWVLPAAAWIRVAVSSVALVALALHLPLAARAHRASTRELAARASGEPAPRIAAEGTQPVWTRRGLLGGGATILAAVAAGVAVDPPAVGLPNFSQPTQPVSPSGNTTTVQVSAKGMRFHPAAVTVPRGDLLRVELRNDEVVDWHDLRIGDVQTELLGQGQTTTLEYGPVGESVQGYCTVVGHRQLGMTFDVVVGD